VEGTCECGNEPSGAINRGEFLDWLVVIVVVVAAAAVVVVVDLYLPTP